jgi:drug/metabolite transporter (DMT)-like permease
LKNRSEALNSRHLNELLSSVGAATLGLGLGSYFSSSINIVEVPLIIAGLISHSIGMYMVRQLDKRSDALPRWTMVAYYLCWILLFTMIVFLVLKPLE